MNKTERKAVVVFFEILAVVIIIGLIVLGTNVLKNRWHKIDFNVTKIVAQKVEGDEELYHITVDGTADTWFYDFNTYKFKLVAGTSGYYIAKNSPDTAYITVNHNRTAEFTLNFDTVSLDDIKNYTFYGRSIYINGNSKEGTDIKMFMSEYVDKLEIVE